MQMLILILNTDTCEQGLAIITIEGGREREEGEKGGKGRREECCSCSC